MVTNGKEYHGFVQSEHAVATTRNQDIDEDGNNPNYPLFSLYEQLHNVSHTHVYISQNIGAPAAYTPLIQFLNTRQPGDVVHIHLNNGGGRLDAGIQIVTAIQNTAAQTVAHLDGFAFSMSAVIFLACDFHNVSPYGRLMLHTYSGGGAGGKAPDQRAAIDALDATYAEIVQSICVPFLSRREVKDMMDNSRDLYFGSEEILERLNPVPKAPKPRQKKKVDAVIEEPTPPEQVVLVEGQIIGEPPSDEMPDESAPAVAD